MSKPHLVPTKPADTPLPRQSWECSECGLAFQPNFDGVEMTIKQRLARMDRLFEDHAAWHLARAGGRRRGGFWSWFSTRWFRVRM